MKPEFGLLVNAESLVHPLSGIGRYTLELLRQYTRHFDGAGLQVFQGSATAPASDAIRRFESQGELHAQWTARRLAFLHWLADRTTLPYRLHQARVQRAFRRCEKLGYEHFVYHEPNFILKPWRGPSVATIHDLSVFHYPQHHPRSRVSFLQENLVQTLDSADRIVTDCELVRAELIERFDVPEEKICAIYLGVDSEFCPKNPEQQEAVLARHGLTGSPYVLCVATFEPRKNVISLIRAWELLPHAIRGHYRLVLAGGKGWGNTQADRALAGLIEKGEAVNLGYVPREDMPALYSAAEAFAFPSLYEGFGLPVLEAMACGTAVITSRATSMAEFAGDCLRLIDPLDIEELSSSLQTLLEDETERAELAQKAAKHAAGFTWERCAEQHLELYRCAMESWQQAKR